MSPLLFNIVAEFLHLLLDHVEKKGIFHGVTLNSNFSLSHLQFADDTILFIKDDVHSIKGIKMVLKLFEVISGLKINF